MRAQLQQLLQGRLLVGHGLAKDLAALGIDHPLEQRFDTMTSPRLQRSKGGVAKSLKALARELLQLEIQKAGRRHDPEEDARAVMQLYTRFAEEASLTGYDDLVAFYTAQALERARAANHAAGDDGGGGGEGG